MGKKIPIRMAGERQRRLMRGMLKPEPRTEKPRMQGGILVSFLTNCVICQLLKSGGRAGGRETENAKSSAALRLFFVFGFFFFLNYFPSLPRLLPSKANCKEITLMGFVFPHHLSKPNYSVDSLSFYPQSKTNR